MSGLINLSLHLRVQVLAFFICLGKTRMETPVHSPQQQCRCHCNRNLGWLNPASDKIPNKFRKLLC
ncbi:hypothetical protein MKW98_023013 [Papaver atlanticum]|uniref:Secreted protein n=1 Tax=Papaver atlanticum TaxID=357466 RepID=A0AAD4TA89_9MAGN|nr:hypothetical protein MKW98_023013 [Papaver atlanticum]